MSDDIDDQLLPRLEAFAAKLPFPVEIPPRIFHTLGGHFTVFDEGSAFLAARFPVKPEYRNPMGFMQGGMIVAAIDNVMGPLCFLCGFGGLSTHINSTFLRPVPPGEEYIDVEARIVERTGTYAHLEGVARNGAGKTAVLCYATFVLAK